MGIFGDVFRVVVVDKVMMANLPVASEGSDDEEYADGKRTAPRYEIIISHPSL